MGMNTTRQRRELPGFQRPLIYCKSQNQLPLDQLRFMLVHAAIPELNLSAACWSPNLVFPLCCCEVSGSSEWCLVSKSPSIPSWGFRCGWMSTFRNTVSHWGPQLRVRVWASGFNTNPVCMSHHCFLCGMGQRLPGDPQCLMAQELSNWRWSWIILPIYCSACKLTSKNI